MRSHRAVLKTIVLLAVLFACGVNAHASETRAEQIASAYAAQEKVAGPPDGNLPDYHLSPAKLVEAQGLERTRLAMHFGSLLWSIAQLVLLLWLGVVAWMRDRATKASAGLRARGKWVRAFLRELIVFAPLFAIVTAALNLPLSAWQHHVSVAHGLSVQRWSSWFGDVGKSFALDLLGTVFFFGLLMAVIRWLPRTWWLLFWALLAPIVLFAIYATPLYVDPLFNHFEPLAKTQPQLVQRLEQVVVKGHMNIPPERMFLMHASAKVTTMNAYVTGFGASERVVVWDTSLKKGTPDEVLFIFGHESGHYVLGHIVEGIAETFFGLLIAFALAYVLLGWAIRRFGPAWRISAPRDWGAVIVFMLLLAVFQAVAEPLINAASRAKEHAADVYGQEAIHGLVADPQAVAQGAFQVLGETSLDVPNVNPLVEFWTYNHPATGRRAAFAHAYNPWLPGLMPKYFPPDHSAR